MDIWKLIKNWFNPAFTIVKVERDDGTQPWYTIFVTTWFGGTTYIVGSHDKEKIERLYGELTNTHSSNKQGDNNV